MKFNAKQSSFNSVANHMFLLTTLVCMSRMCGMSTGKPFSWQNLFGRTDAKEAKNTATYDRSYEDRANWTTIDWIEKYNYTCEQFNVTTADGYQLQLQRLPRNGQRPILLLHGLLMSSLSWVLMGANKSLAFQLYDSGYDVWLANFRGSHYGRQHVRLNATQSEFWNYSFHEQGLYDLPTIIDCVRETTSFHQVMLVGHSQAFNAFLVLCSLRWEYNERILFMQALAPIAELRNYVKFAYADMRRVTKFLKQKEKSKSFEIFPEAFLKQKCLQTTAEEQKSCLNLTKTFTGPWQYSKKMHYLIYGQLLEGGSVKELTHLEQIWKSGDFVAFDYGVVGNLKYYNAVQPYNYNLSQITAPIVLHFGETDAMATPKGVHHIYSHLLRQLSNILGVYRIAAAKFNHLDFVCANQIDTLVNAKIIAIMEKYLKGKLQYVIE